MSRDEKDAIGHVLIVAWFAAWVGFIYHPHYVGAAIGVLIGLVIAWAVDRWSD